MHLKNENKIVNILLISIALLILLFACYSSFAYVPHDFSNYYFAGYFLKNSWLDYSIYHQIDFNQKIRADGFENIFVSYAPNPPFVALVFYPLSFFELHFAKLIFNVFSLIVFFFSIKRVFDYLNLSYKYILLIPFVFFTPIKNNILFGQQYLLLFVLLIEGYLASERGQLFRTSIFWAFSIFLKVFPLIIFPYLLIRKQYKTALYLGASCIIFLLFSFLFIEVDIWYNYFTEILPRANSGEVILSYVVNFQTMHMFLKYVFVQNDLFNPTPIFDHYYFFLFGIILFKSIILFFTIQQTISFKQPFYIFSIWITASLLISPYGNTYSMMLLLIPILSIVHLKFKKQIIIAAVILVFLISNLPVRLFSELPVVFQFPRLILMLIFFFLVLKEYSIHIPYFIAIVLLFLLTSIPSFSNDRGKSKYLLNQQKHALIFDYFEDEGSLVYKYWSGEGPKIHKTMISVKSLLSENVEVINNQIYYKGVQQTYSPDWKDKPTIMNGEYLIYLSDKGNGPGFYTLRKISLNN